MLRPDNSASPAPATSPVIAITGAGRGIGRSADPQQAMHLLRRLVRGDADTLSGRHISVHDDLDALPANIDAVLAHDLYVMRPVPLVTAAHERQVA